MNRKSAEALTKLHEVDFGQQAYRGYLIRTNALSNTMWIEKGGHLICHVPAAESWEWARKSVDELLSNTCHCGATNGGKHKSSCTDT
jgi:hypothetical protein